MVGHFEFSAHGEAVDGSNKGPVYTHHSVSASLKISRCGVLYATALCNIHGLWESAKESYPGSGKFNWKEQLSDYSLLELLLS
jgi:desulfoferrodoxin (superoxide reductase-like protein)